MALPTIFCPQCDHLILAAAECPQCGWQRPLRRGDLGRPVWAVALEAKLPRQYSRPVAAGRLIYIPTADGRLAALETDPTRAEAAIRWRQPLGPDSRCFSVTVWEDTLLLGLEYTGHFPQPPGALRVLSAQSGEELWRYPVEGASLSVPAVANGIAYFTVNTGWLYALDLASRQELWRRKLELPWQWGPAQPGLTPTGLLVLPGQSGALVAYHLERADIAWRFSAGGWFAHTPVWADGFIYARCWDRHLYALEAASGRLAWRCAAPRDYSSDVWVGPEYLYIGAKDYQAGADQGPRAYALYTLERQTGQRVGRYEVPGHIFGRPVATEEAVFFATDDRSPDLRSQGTVYALDVRGQQPLWAPYIAEQRFQSDLLLLGDWLVAGSRQGAIYALRWRAGVTTAEAPEDYLARAEGANAAVAYALQGDYAQAAKQAEQAGETVLAIELYRRLGQPARAAALAAAAGRLEQALRLYREAGQPLEAAETLERLGRYDEAAAAFLEARRWGRAAQSWERWVDLALERAGGVRHVGQTAELEAGLEQAIALFEQGADYAEAESKIERYNQRADDCRLKLMQLRREPLLRLSLQAGQLIYNQGNAIHYRIENVGWGTARKLRLTVSSSDIRPLEPLALGALRRHRQREGVVTVVPQLVGQVLLRVELRGQSGSGELRQSLAEPMTVARGEDLISNLAGAGVTLNLQNYVGPGARSLAVDEAALASRGRLWQEGSEPSPEAEDGPAVSQAALTRQVEDERGSLRRRLLQHQANLNKLRERAAIYGAGETPLHLINQLEAEEKIVHELEQELRHLEER